MNAAMIIGIRHLLVVAHLRRNADTSPEIYTYTIILEDGL